MVEVGTSESDGNVIALTTRGRAAVLAFTDLDGTANNEELPEGKRLDSIGPAQEVIGELQGLGVQAGVITGRSFGEALLYANALGCRGPIICEDGAILVLPQDHNLEAGSLPGDLRQKIVQHCGRWVVALSQGNIEAFQGVVANANSLLQETHPGHTPMISSTELAALYSETNPITQAAQLASSEPFQRIKQWIGYDADQALLAAAHRIATCFVAMENFAQFDQTGPLDFQRECLFNAAKAAGLETFSPRLPHLRAPGIDKAAALSILNQYPSQLLGMHCAGIVPVCFGNNDNDVRMMQQLGEYDGVGVVVGHPDLTKGHYINRDTVTSQSVFISSQPYGHGMREGLSFVYQRLTENLGVTLKNR